MYGHRRRMSNTVDKAQVELDRLPHNHLAKTYIAEILALLEKFADEGHSGGSAPYGAAALSDTIRKLCLHQPLTPITGDDYEWNDVSEYSDGNVCYQNTRCSAIFKGDQPKSYYLDAVIWRMGDSCFSGTVDGVTSRQNIVFPFTPKTFYVDVYEVDDEYHITDPVQLDAVAEYYTDLRVTI
jgi:hypothetical protein